MIRQIKKLLNFFDLDEKVEFYKLTIFSIIITLLELTGIGLVIPIITMLFDGNIDKYIPKSLIEILFFGADSKKEIMSFILIYFFLVIFIKNSLVLIMTHRQLLFVTNFQKKYSDILFKKYIFSDFLELKRSNSSLLISNIINEVSEVANNYLMPCILLLSELILILSIFIFLMIFDTKLTLLVSIVMIFVIFLYFLFLNKKLKSWGESRQLNLQLKIKTLQEGFSSIKETKLYQKENFFLTLFRSFNLNYASINKKYLFFSSVPKHVFEIVSVAIFIIFILLTFSATNSPEIVIQKIAVFSFVAFRILPSFNKITSSLQRIKFGNPAMKLVSEVFDKNYLRTHDSEKNENIKFEKSINFIDLGFSFDKKKYIFKNFNFNIKKREIVCLIGKSGSGKSTLLEILMTLISPDKGKILIDNKYNIFDSKNVWKSKIGYVPQFVYFTDDTIRKNIAFGIKDEDIDDTKIIDSIEKSGLSEFINNLSEGVNYRVGEFGGKLSGGEKQRLGIARAMYNNPNILILDEPTSSLDEESETKVLNQIKKLKENVTIIIATHDETVKNICDVRLKISNNKIESL
jgi:ATP-binding cassette, subfamily B, bacterial PglK